MTDSIPITQKGYQELLKKLKHLKAVERPKVVEDIREAREHGDLSENAEYDAAKEKQALLEKKINQIQTRISQMQIIDVEKISLDKIVFGATVKLYDINNDSETIYQIVGEDESDINQGLISITSPIAKALIGKSKDDEVSVITPNGKREFAILEIRYK